MQEREDNRSSSSLLLTQLPEIGSLIIIYMPLSIESNGSAKTKPREGVKAKVSGLPSLAPATASTQIHLQIQIQLQMRMRPGAMRGEDVAQFSLSTLFLAIVSLFVAAFAESSGSVRFGFDCDLLRARLVAGFGFGFRGL